MRAISTPVPVHGLDRGPQPADVHPTSALLARQRPLDCMTNLIEIPDARATSWARLIPLGPAACGQLMRSLALKEQSAKSRSPPLIDCYRPCQIVPLIAQKAQMAPSATPRNQ